MSSPSTQAFLLHRQPPSYVARPSTSPCSAAAQALCQLAALTSSTPCSCDQIHGFLSKHKLHSSFLGSSGFLSLFHHFSFFVLLISWTGIEHAYNLALPSPHLILHFFNQFTPSICSGYLDPSTALFCYLLADLATSSQSFSSDHGAYSFATSNSRGVTRPSRTKSAPRIVNRNVRSPGELMVGFVLSLRA